MMPLIHAPYRTLILFGLLGLYWSNPKLGMNLVAQESPIAYFENNIRPLLLEKCISCHGPEKQKGGLRLDTAQGWKKGGDNGPAIVPGDPEKSLLVQAIRYSREDLKMPPESKGGKLALKQIIQFETWIKMGASDPRVPNEPNKTSSIADPRTFWSFQPIKAIIPPQIPGNKGINNPVDAFIAQKLAVKGLVPSPRADARTLLRRATFDLTGLPPTPGEIRAFEADSSQEAFERVVDRLLASPQYGERWGKHWLDVARYADSGGYETDIYYRNAWRYRDYVVKSFNNDKPYDRFVKEQIAGDEIWPDDIDLDGNYVLSPEKRAHQEARIGTGFYTLGPQIHESNMDGKKIRYETLTDWVDTTGAAFLGLTFGCARCHDHKFDPISQKDYYGLQAIFAPSKETEVPIISAMGIADFKQHYPRVVALDEARRAYRIFEGKTRGRELTPAEKTEKQQLMERLAGEVLAVQPSTAQGEPFDGLFEIPSVSILSHERPELVKKVYLLNRGELTRSREEIGPQFPQAIRLAEGVKHDPQKGMGERRKALANWMVEPSHPLTARVMVNRIWQGHFGRGIVGTPNDFGQMGERPTHPELLDWLASEFIRKGWSIKALHKTLMLSATYQRESRNCETNASIDPSNQWLWRMNRKRLEAEALWDSIHSVAGTLNLKMGGRPVVPPLGPGEQAPANWIVSADPSEHSRRGMYILLRRNFRFPMFDVFDAPVNAVSAPGRDVTTVATQALWMLNNQTANHQAREFAKRIRGEQNLVWNGPDFGPGQTGWEGIRGGIHAGWAKRISTPKATPNHDAPIGTIMTHGPTSVLWKADRKGDFRMKLALWNIRHLGRSGPWKLWKNEKELVAEGTIGDNSGTSKNPLVPKLPPTISLAPGDSIQLEILEDDFVGVRFSVGLGKFHRDLGEDFTLESNPTPTGWAFAESIANGSAPLSKAIEATMPGDLNSLVTKAWRMALGRAPNQKESEEAVLLLQKLSPQKPEEALPQLCLALFNLQEFSYID